MIALGDSGGSPFSSRRPPRRWRLQFGLATLMVATMLFSFLAALLGGLLRERPGAKDNTRLVFFIIMAVAAPMLVTIAISLIKPAVRLVAHLRQARRRPK